MVDISKIKALIRAHLLKFPKDDNPFWVKTVFYKWVSPQKLEDILLLEAILRILENHNDDDFFLLDSIDDQEHAEQFRSNILSFLNEDDEFNKKIEEKLNRLKRSARLKRKLLEQFRDIVNSSEGIDFIDSPEQNGLLRSGLGIYRENNKLFINRFYADHSLIVNFLKYIFWELLRRKLLNIFKLLIKLLIKLLNIVKDLWSSPIIKFSLTVIFTSIISIIVYKNLISPPSVPKPSLSPVGNSHQIAALCDEKQYGNLNISCGHPANPANKEEDANKPDSLIYKNNQDILGQIKSGTLSEKDVYPIAAVVPLTGQAEDVAHNILRGVAEKQEEYNKQDKSKLFVLIADDANKTKTGQSIAKKLGEIKILLGVVGSYSSSNSAGVIQNYRTSKLVLVSPTTTATLSDLDESYRVFINRQTNLDKLDKSFFFRPVGTTKEQIRDTLQYLKNKTKVILFWDSGDTFAKSLKNELENQIKNLSISMDDFPSNGFSSAELGDMTKKKISQPNISQQDSTAILIFQGAFKDQNEKNEIRKKAKSIILANQGHFLVIGSNPVYRTDLMCDFINEPNFAQISSNLLIMQPWFPEPNDDLYPKPFNCNNKNPQDSFVPWQVVMSKDATQMLIYAINKAKASNSGDPIREKIQEALRSNEIQDETCTDKNKGINGLTGNITLHGSDRCNPSSELVRPIYLKDTKQWQWQKLPKPYK